LALFFHKDIGDCVKMAILMIVLWMIDFMSKKEFVLPWCTTHSKMKNEVFKDVQEVHYNDLNFDQMIP